MPSGASICTPSVSHLSTSIRLFLSERKWRNFVSPSFQLVTDSENV